MNVSHLKEGDGGIDLVEILLVPLVFSCDLILNVLGGSAQGQGDQGQDEQGEKLHLVLIFFFFFFFIIFLFLFFSYKFY